MPTGLRREADINAWKQKEMEWLKLRLKKGESVKAAMMVALQKTTLQKRGSDRRACLASPTSHP
jgi:hypothetical protein